MSDRNKVKVVNKALSRLGKEPVPDLGDASLAASNAAVKLLRVIEDVRDSVLRRHGWECSLTYQTLAPAAGAPVSPSGAPNWRYQTAFPVPGDFLRVWEIQNPWMNLALNGLVPPDDWGMAAAWPGPYLPEERWQVNTVENDVGSTSQILTYDQLDSLNLCYVRRVGWGALDPHLRDAIAEQLAFEGCFDVTGDQARADKLEKSAEGKIQLAISVDGTQEGGQPPLATSLPGLIRNVSR